MNVLVVGAGMYVTGREGSGCGTILSSLAECSRHLRVSQVTIIGKKAENSIVVKEASDRINSILGTDLIVSYRPISGKPDLDIANVCAEATYDCAIVCVPDHLHHAFAKALLLEKVPVLIVKPLTPTLDEARELIEIQEKNGIYAAVEFHKRWDATNLWVANALSSGKLGRVQYINVEYSQKISIPLSTFREWADRTNIFQYLGVHYVDLIYFLTGFVPIRALGIGTEGVLRQSGVANWDSIHATVVWCNPRDASDTFVSSFATNWIDPTCTSAMSDQKYKVIGSKGHIECDQKNRGLELVHENLGIQQINPYFSEFLPDGNGGTRFSGYGHESINRFLKDVIDLQAKRKNVAELEQHRPTLKQALVSTAVIESVNKSLKDNSSWQAIHASI